MFEIKLKNPLKTFTYLKVLREISTIFAEL